MIAFSQEDLDILKHIFIEARCAWQDRPGETSKKRYNRTYHLQNIIEELPKRHNDLIDTVKALKDRIADAVASIEQSQSQIAIAAEISRRNIDQLTHEKNLLLSMLVRLVSVCELIRIDSTNSSLPFDEAYFATKIEARDLVKALLPPEKQPNENEQKENQTSVESVDG